jgi:hypothetical protein
MVEGVRWVREYYDVLEGVKRGEAGCAKGWIRSVGLFLAC